MPELGVRIYGDNFVSPQAAKLAGEKALRELLDAISKQSDAVRFIHSDR